MKKGGPKPTPARFAVAENVKRLLTNYVHPDKMRQGIGSRELAAKLGGKISYKTIDRLMNPYHDGSPNLDTLDAIATFFGIETDMLLRRTLMFGEERRTPEETAHSASSKTARR